MAVTKTPISAPAADTLTPVPDNYAATSALLFDYGAENFITDEGLDVIRRRPKQFLNSTGHDGLLHGLKELFDNSIDEATFLRSHGINASVRITIIRDRYRGTYQALVIDNGRGIPASKFYNALTKPHTSAKYNAKSTTYLTSIGTFGVGLKATIGTAEHARGVTFRPDEGVSSSIYVNRGKHNSDATREPYGALSDLARSHEFPLGSGTMVIYEPDAEIFQEIDSFGDIGPMLVAELLKKILFFAEHNITVKISDTPLPPTIWTASNAEAVAMMLEADRNASVYWDAAAHDREAWIRQYWNVQRPWALQVAFNKPMRETNGLQDWAIRIYYAKYSTGARLGIINDVPIDHARSDHLRVVYDELRKAIAPLIEDKAIRNFFLSDYELPLYLAVGAKYEGAVFTGATKHAFNNPIFREAYRSDIQGQFTTPEGGATIGSIYAAIADDIEVKYKASQDIEKSFTDNANLFKALRRHDKMKHCTATDRSRCELFIVEGDSAKGRTGQDTVHTALYAISGKPLNPKTLNLHGGELRRHLLTEVDIYHDIFTALGYDPKNPKTTGLNFARCFIMTDADTHGGHIASILLTAFHIIAPELVEAGFFHIVTPPYYEVRYGKGKNPTKFYMRTADDILNWRIAKLYKQAYVTEIAMARSNSTMCVEMEDDVYNAFCRSVLNIGVMLERLEQQLSCPAPIIEFMAMSTAYLPDEGEEFGIPLEAYTELIGADRIHYERNGYLLIITLADRDYTIPLHGIKSKLYTGLVGALSRMGRVWTNVLSGDRIDRRLDIEIYMRSRHTQALERKEFTLYEIYKAFLELDKILEYKAFKGLGEMDPADKYTTCMDPRFRSAVQVTGIGDVKIVYELLGDDSAARKKLTSERIVSTDGALSDQQWGLS